MQHHPHPPRRSFLPRWLLLGWLALMALQRDSAAQSLPERLSLRINLPAYRLEVYRGEERIRSYPAAIGLPSYPTPQGLFTVYRITWNPWWDPPDRPWARGEMRTPPGPGNPMGRAKIEFDELYYIHGSREALGRPASHGCIRLSNAHVLELARLLATETGVLPAHEVDPLESNARRTREVALPAVAAVAIRIVYRLTEEVDGELAAYEDVYDRGLSSRDRFLRGGR